MSVLSDKTERKAVKVLANTLRFFENTDLLFSAQRMPLPLGMPNTCFGRSLKAMGTKPATKKEKELKF